MKIVDLYEMSTTWVSGKFATVEVFENPSFREIAKNIFAGPDKEYSARGFFVPAKLSKTGHDFYAMWSAKVLHYEVLEHYGYGYGGVVKLSVNPQKFAVLHYNNPTMTSGRIIEICGDSVNELNATLMGVRGLNHIMKGKRFSVE